jgi:aspartyl protease family protein
MSNNANETEQKSTIQRSASVMSLLAWLCVFGLAVWGFSGLLDKQNNPNQNVISSVENGRSEVRLKQNRQGHYVASGKINGETVTFLVDTGATSVAIPAHLAKQLNLQARGSGISRTANGSVEVRFTTIDSLQLGDIELRDIRATLLPNMNDDEILLGMSVLRQLEFTQRGEWLILRSL